MLSIDRMLGNAKRILGILKKTFESRVPGLWKDQNVSLVRSYFEYAVQAWNPYFQEDFDKIERVQRRATSIPTGFEKI